MKKKTIIVIILIAIIAALFPIPTTFIFSGHGEVLNLQKEKIGTCELEIEIKEISSLTFCYKKSFTFAIDGSLNEEFETASYSEANDICLISQMYYDKKADMMSLASLIYPNDATYAILNLGANYYFINNGASISYAELPIS